MKKKFNFNIILFILLGICILFFILIFTGVININNSVNKFSNNPIDVNLEEAGIDERCGHREDGKTITDPNNPNVKLICTYMGNTCPRYLWKVKETNIPELTENEMAEPGKKCGHLRDGNIIDNPNDPNTKLICTYIEDNEPKFTWQIQGGDIVRNYNNNQEIKEGNACGYKKLGDVEEDIYTSKEIICKENPNLTPSYIWQKV